MLAIEENSFTRYEFDRIARNFEFALREDDRTRATYLLERDNLAHVCTRDREEFEINDVRIIATSVIENYTQAKLSKNRDQIRTIARMTIDQHTHEIDTTIHFRYTRYEVTHEHFIRRAMRAEFESAYDASHEYDLAVANFCLEESLRIMNTLDALRRMISRHSTLRNAKSDEKLAELEALEHNMRAIIDDLQMSECNIL